MHNNRIRNKRVQIKMKRNRIIIQIILLLMAPHISMAQDIEVKGFELVVKDNAAIENPRKDLNKNTCGLVKVALVDEGFVFSGNVVGEVIHQSEEYWVYLCQGTKRLNIKHPNYIPMTIVFEEYGIKKIESGKTYRLSLIGKKNKETKSATKRFVTIDVNPFQASLSVDNDIIPKEENGKYIVSLTEGVHLISAFIGEFEMNKAINVSKSNKPFIIDLTEFFSTINITSSIPDAHLYINNEMISTGSWNGKIPPGKTLFEAKKDGYETQSKTFVLMENDSINISFQNYNALKGKLIVDYLPKNTSVYIDDLFVGNTPLQLDDIKAGSHIIKLENQYCKTTVKTININKDQEILLNGQLEYKDCFSKVFVKAHDGEAESQYILGMWRMGDKFVSINMNIVCYDGFDDKIDKKEGISWLIKSGEQNYYGAYQDLAYCYYNGTGVERDYRKTFYWLKKAENERTNPGYDIFKLLGYLYMYGRGVEKDYQKAAQYFRKTIIRARGHKEAETKLKEIGYESLIPKNYEIE